MKTQVHFSWMVLLVLAGAFVLQGQAAVAQKGKKPPGSSVCSVDTARELMITSVTVVNDPLRTTWATDPSVDPRSGSWTLGGVMRKIAGTHDGPAMVKALFDSWTADQIVNGQLIAARPKMATKVTGPWLAASGGTALDLKKAPFMLSAIVNRMDLQDLSRNSAGEGRMVYSFVTSATNGVSISATAIFEFNLYAQTQADVDLWAADWHALGSLTLGSTAYNDALGNLVDRFVSAGSLLRFLTNEVAFDPASEVDSEQVEQFRQFHLTPTRDAFEIVPVALTPANSLDGTLTLANFVNQNEAAILADTPVPSYTVPQSFEGSFFQGGAVLGPKFVEGSTATRGFWKAQDIFNNDARHKFSVNTCNGCHNLPETGTGAVHVFRRKNRANKPAPEARLSGFLTGITVPDPVSGASRTFNELAKRNAAFTAMVCP